MNVGYVGLGALGRELAGCFQGSHRLAVWDVNPAARAQFASAGVEVAESAVALARRSEVVLLCLPRSAEVRQVVLGPLGLVEGLAPGTLLIDQTSGTPGETSRIAAELQPRGIEMLDAAVSANPQFVRSGGATLMVAGPDCLVQRALPILEVITSTIRRCGSRVGDGQAMSLVNNGIYAATRLGTLEVAALARKAGLGLAAVHEAWRSGIARSQATEKMIPALLEGKASTNFALSLMLKDVNQAVELGMAHDSPMPLSALTRALLQAGLNTLGPQAQLEDMIGFVESVAGVRLAGGIEGMTTTDARLLKTLEKAVAAICLLATVECVTAGLKYGLQMPAVREVLGCSSGGSAAGEAWMQPSGAEASLSREALRPWVDAQRVAVALAMRCGTPAVLSSCAHDRFVSASAGLVPEADLGGLARLFAHWQPPASV
jgi:3-hydroxyisobutyrate dehydrogenase